MPVWTEPQDWLGGDSVTHTLLNLNLTDNEKELYHLIALQSADVTVNNSTVFVNLTGLSLAVVSGEVWVFFGTVQHKGSSVGNIKFTVTAPAASTGRFGLISDGASGTATNSATYGGAVTRGLTVDYVESNTTIAGVVTAGADGTMQVQGAQNAAGVEDLIFRKDSFIVAFRKSYP